MANPPVRPSRRRERGPAAALSLRSAPPANVPKEINPPRLNSLMLLIPRIGSQLLARSTLPRPVPRRRPAGRMRRKS